MYRRTLRFFVREPRLAFRRQIDHVFFVQPATLLSAAAIPTPVLLRTERGISHTYGALTTIGVKRNSSAPSLCTVLT